MLCATIGATSAVMAVKVSFILTVPVSQLLLFVFQKNIFVYVVKTRW
jgi:hypothetical protein